MYVQIFGPLKCEYLGPYRKDLSLSGPVIFVDAGIQHIKSLETELTTKDEMPVLWIGDHDGFDKGSVQEQKWQELFEKLQHSQPNFLKLNFKKDKDQSDLALALDWLSRFLKDTKRNSSEVIIKLHGLIGGALDHQIAAFGELSDFVKGVPEQLTLVMANQDGSIAAEIAKGTFEKQAKGSFSLISFAAQDISLSGDIRYSGLLSFKPFSSLGLSNDVDGKLKIEAEAPYMILWK